MQRQSLNDDPRQLLDDEVRQVTAVVTAVADGRFVVRTRTRGLTARAAASCLVTPEPGDVVLLALGEQATYVLAVLERKDAPLKLCIDGDGEIEVRGKLSLTAKEAVAVASPDVSLLSGRLDVRAVDAGVALERLSMFGRYLQGEIEKVKLLGDTFDTVFERVSQRVRRSFRTVTEVEQVRTENLDMRARRTMNLHGENTVITAKKLVKLDGDQIHVG